MKGGARFTMPLNSQEIIQLLKTHQWNIDDADAVKDLIELIRSVEKIHGIT